MANTLGIHYKNDEQKGYSITLKYLFVLVGNKHCDSAGKKLDINNMKAN